MCKDGVRMLRIAFLLLCCRLCTKVLDQKENHENTQEKRFISANYARPVVMATVPRLWEAIKRGFDDALKDMPVSRQILFSFLSLP